jgi:lipoprotein-releasing system permease protein
VSTWTLFELFTARRYLVSKRRQQVASLITVISIAGVAAGVMAMVIALAINNGFRQTLQGLLLGATAHVSILERQPGEGIRDWRGLTAKLRGLPHVIACEPALYGSVFFAGPVQSSGGVLKGSPSGPGEGVRMGSKLAAATGMNTGSRVTLISPQGELTPFGPRPSYFQLRVEGTFETGFYDLDSSWASASLPTAQKVLGTGDAVNAIELKLDDIHRAGEVAAAARPLLAESLLASTWTEQNRPLLNALRTERTVTAVTVGLIQLVAALNILITLTMIVMEKRRDIAILSSLGATASQIRRIFILQGGLIGLVGAVLGLAAGYAICYFAERGRWIELDPQVYALGYLPFDPRWSDALWIGAAAIAISLLATLHPARSAARIDPAEALRYE